MIKDCYYYLFNAPYNSFGVALTYFEMSRQEHFAGFDFVGEVVDGSEDVWTIETGHCPKLTWQENEGPQLAPSKPHTTLSGSGHADDPYVISNPLDFLEFYSNPDLCCGYYKLMTDIDLADTAFSNSVVNRFFGGHFEGSNHTIRNVTIDGGSNAKDYMGLFRVVSASITNLRIENIHIMAGDSSDYLGGLCGENSYGTINNCSVTGSVNGGTRSKYLGCLCGINGGVISHCFTRSSVTGGAGAFWLGGMCGSNRGTISDSCAAGIITGGNSLTFIGGLCGDNTNLDSIYSGADCVIVRCYATSDVKGGKYSTRLGGLCGKNYGGTNPGLIMDCYASGDVTAGEESDCLGGLCGYNDVMCDISGCCATGYVVGDTIIGGLCGRNRGNITNCYATGGITGYCHMGGLCGENSDMIQNCYATGGVVVLHESCWDYGGLIGDDSSANVRNASFWDTDTSGITAWGPGTGLPTTEMQRLSTYVNAGWDFVETDGDPADWRMLREGEDYPRLAWQEVFPGDISGLYGVDTVDFTELAAHWHQSGCPDDCEDADINQDGTVDMNDFLLLSDNWLLP